MLIVLYFVFCLLYYIMYINFTTFTVSEVVKLYHSVALWKLVHFLTFPAQIERLVMKKPSYL
jgi:fucose 4-O-acetylase-like acetyltransferase